MLRKSLTVAAVAAASAIVIAAIAQGIAENLASTALADAERNMTVIYKTSTAPWPIRPARIDMEESCAIGICQDI